MIEFTFRINNPFAKDNGEQKDYFLYEKMISKNWAIESQCSKWAMDKLLEIHIDTSWRGKDHAGPSLYVELFGYMFSFKIYNINHWNYKTGTWVKRKKKS